MQVYSYYRPPGRALVYPTFGRDSEQQVNGEWPRKLILSNLQNFNSSCSVHRMNPHPAGFSELKQTWQ